MKIGQSWYPPVTKVPETKPFWKCAVAALTCFAIFAGWGVMLAWR
jgi:hypothetical protein